VVVNDRVVVASADHLLGFQGLHTEGEEVGCGAVYSGRGTCFLDLLP